MFKNRNRTYLTLCILLIGTCSSVFAIDLSQAFSQSTDQSAWIDSLFKWTSTISNLYFKALKVVKDKEVVATTTSLDQLQSYFTTCSSLKNVDFINILYSSNFSFKNTFDLILPPWTTQPTKSDIDKSRAKFFVCSKITNPTDTDLQNLNNQINKIYYDVYSNSYTMSTLNKSNFWSDLFWNGTLDDSDFDLLYDINQVGKILFDTFTDSPQVLFYRLPKSPTGSNGDASSSSSPNAYQLWGWWSTATTTWWPTGTSSPLSSWENFSGVWWTTTTTTSSSSASPSSVTNASVLADKEVQKFIETTNPTLSSSPAAVALLFWNQCLTSNTPPPSVEQQTPLMTPEEYLSGISNFIANANIDDVINTNLLTQFTTNNPLPSWWSTSDSWYSDAIANAYAEKAFGDAPPGTCEYACNGLSLDKQAQCQLSCAKSCIQKCDGLWLQDKVLCVSDCTCFLIAGPNGKWWEKMENMFSIKFCKVPVQMPILNPWKTVFSIQAIFQEISDTLQWLKDSGKTTKYSKTKEFLDGNIKINFADTFAFKLQVWFKPVFSQKATTVKLQEQAQANTDLNIGVLDMNTSAPTADDYNKYILGSGNVLNDAGLLPTTSLADIDQNIADVTAAVAKSQEAKLSSDAISAVLTTYAQNTHIIFVQNMIEFLKNNQIFLQNLSDALLDMSKMSLELKTKIQNSK